MSSSPASSSSSSSSASTLSLSADGLLRRSASTEWRDWEASLDALSCGAGALEMDLAGFDHMLLANADDFLEPFESDAHAAPSPVFATDSEFYYEREQDLSMLEAAGIDTTFPFGGDEAPTAAARPEQQREAMQRQRKRKSVELQRLRTEAERLASESAQLDKKMKMAASTHEVASVRSERAANQQAEKLFRRRYDILHGILEAWNTGVIEDMEEIADTVYDDDVTLISPDNSEGLRGVQAVLAHWNTLLDVFPDGIMEEYEVQRGDADSDTLKATWVFSGTQIVPIHGVEPRHEKVKISGTTFYAFKGDKIRRSVVTWNYRETLLKLMGVQPERPGSLVRSAHVVA